jgi:hypothetical protein
MLNWLINRRLAAFEREFGYDVTYARDILAVSPLAFRRFASTMGLSSYRRNVPPAPWFAAKIDAAMAEDCGPCTQLVVTMAERAGVAPQVLRAILARDDKALPEDVALAVRFTEAVLQHDEAADESRNEILRRWDRAGLVSLSFAITASRLYPTMKYALGRGHACVRVTVGGQPAPFVKHGAVAVSHP